jgi:dienelactone hydrolase
MRKLSFVFCSLFINALIMAQPFGIGHKQITFVDASRSNRSILTEIYYPSTTSGDNVPIANGQFPVIVFGHGFVMTWDAYKCFWDTLVPEGYILVFPRTEGSISPNHNEFGKDLKFLNEQMKNENTNPSSFFYQKISSKSSIMGHSMGGGSSFLAAASYTNFTTLVNFAAANTNPSSISAAQFVSVPLLMFAGENDGVTPPANHQIPMYDSCSSLCKTIVTIKGGGHCYFANYNFNCSFGESTTSPQPTITRDEQQRRVFYLLKPYLNYMLKNSSVDSVKFFNRLQNNSEYTYQRTCNITTNILTNNQLNKISVYPNPFKNSLKIKIDNNEKVSIEVYNILGEKVNEFITNTNEIHLNTENWGSGIYFIKVNTFYFKVIKE